MKEQPDSSRPEPPLASEDQGTDHELADQTVERGFRLLSLSAVVFVVAALTFYCRVTSWLPYVRRNLKWL